MATQADIAQEKNNGIAILDDKIDGANGLINGGETSLVSTLNTLTQHRADLFAQAYTGELDDPSLQAALAKLQSATADMNKVARQMVDATSYLGKVNSLGSATNSAISALKGV